MSKSVKANKGALRYSTMSIQPHITSASNMGLEKYEMVLMDATSQRFDLACETNGNIITYKTGLNEMGPEVQSITDPEKKKDKIAEIRGIVAWLENVEAGNYKVNPDTCMEGYGTSNDHFWENVKVFKSVFTHEYDNRTGMRIPTYWDSNIFLVLDNDGQVLDVSKPKDMAIKYCIMAGGFSEVAPSLEEAENRGARCKFYLDVREETAKIRTEYKKLRNDAGGELNNMLKRDTNRLFYVGKLVAPNSMQYKTGKNGTPMDIIYEDVDLYLDGKGIEKVKETAIKYFLELATAPMQHLILHCLVKDAKTLNLIMTKGDGGIYYLKTDSYMGKTIGEVVAWLDNPLNENIKKELSNIVESKWE